MKVGRLVWVVAVLDVAVFLVSSTVDPAFDAFATALYVIGIASFTAVGALLCVRVPTNPIGTLLLGAGTLLVAAVAIGTYANAGALQEPAWPGSGLARAIGDVLYFYPFVIALIWVPLVFPDGRLPSPCFRWVIRITIAYLAAWTVLGVAFEGAGTTARIPAFAVLVPFVGVVEAFVLVATLVSFGAAVVAVWLRFRHGDQIRRQQIKWLVAVVALASVTLPASFVLTDASPGLANALTIIAVFALFALPIAIGIAVLRYRLYEIDRIISRTIGWLLVTGILATVFVLLILGLQGVLAPVTKSDTLAVAASTLVAAALFQPLRGRVQHAVDRRFNRSRVDAERATAAFAGLVRDEVDLALLRDALVATASDAVRPVDAAVWLRPGARMHA